MAGVTASAVGAALIAGMAFAPLACASRPAVVRAIPIALGGFIGALVDSLLGATVQEVRFCDSCAVETEERVHGCGARTRPTHGVPWCDNDVVNGLATATGAMVSILLEVVMPNHRR
jgi:uncharacterized membrane protein